MAVTNNVLLAAPNIAAAASFSGGAWTVNRPLSRLSSDQPSDFARAIGADKRNTWFYAVLPMLEDAGVVVPSEHNLQPGIGKHRVRYFTADPRAPIDWVLTGEVAPPGLTTLRSGNATYIGRDKRLHTVGANVLRFAFDLDTGLPLGLMYEHGVTNRALYCRDLTQVSAWSPTNVTPTLAATGIDGAANTATRVVANFANATLKQAFTLGAATRCFSVFIKRVSGTGTVNISGDNLTTRTAVVLSSTAPKRFKVQATGANPTICIELTTSGDVIEVDYAQFEDGAEPTSPILTTSATATRAADSPRLSGAQDYGIAGAVGTIAVRARLATVPAAITAVATLYAGAGDYLGIGHDGTRCVYTVVRSSEQVGANGALLAAGGVATHAMAWAANNVRTSTNGAATATDGAASMPNVGTWNLFLGSIDGNTVNHAGYIERVRIYASQYTAAQIEGLSGADLEVPADWDSGEVDAWQAAWVAVATAREKARTPGCGEVLLPATVQRLYWRYDMVDETNPNPLQLARLIIAPAKQPAINMTIGARLGYESRDLIVEAESGAEFAAKRRPRRVIQFPLGLVAEDEAMGLHLQLQAELGTWGEVYVSWSATDTTHKHRRSFVGRLRKLEPLETMAVFGCFTTAYEVSERL